MSKRTWLSVFLIATSSATIAAPLPAGFDQICTSAENCAVDGTALVAFGTPESATLRTVQGTFLCAGSTFGVATPANAGCYLMNTDSISTVPVDAALPQDGAKVVVVSRFSGKALTRLTQGDSQRVVQRDFSSAEEQQWLLKRGADGFIALLDPTGQVAVDVRDWTISDGARLQTSSWMDSWSQHWFVEPANGHFVQLVSRMTGKSVDVFEMNQKQNGPICTWTYWGGDNQHWRLLPL